MKNAIKFISLLIFLFHTVGVYAESRAQVNTNIVNATISAFMKENAIPGVAASLYVDGQPSSYYYGFANLDKKIAVTDKTIFEVGSISKVMTSILLAQEVDFAKMYLTDPVTKYVKDLPSSFDHITLQSLATHTSGLPFTIPASVTTETELQAYFANWKANNNFQNRWQYSNVGIGLLGDALEEATNWDFNKLYTRHILNPLHMQAIGITVPAKFNKYYAQGYDKTGDPIHPTEPRFFKAAYGLKMMAGDMQKFLGAAIGLPGTPPRVMWPMRLTQSIYVKYADQLQGLGWSIHPLSDNHLSALLQKNQANFGPARVQTIYERPLYDGNALIDKTGETNGFRAYIAVIPNKKTGIVILANKNVPRAVIVKTGRELLFKLNKWMR
jgi:beta-lactamase class C